MITQKGRFLIRHEEMDSDYLERFDFEKLEEKYQEIKAFYLFEGDLPIVRVYFIYSPEEFLFLTGRKFESWMSATVGDHSTINIFAPSMIEKYTTHKKESIFRTIAHELSHLFYGHSKFVNLPLFNEGIAEYHGDNHCDNKINFKLPTLIGGKDQKYDYGVGHLLVCSIMEYFREQGNIKLIQFLKQITKDMKENDIFELFKQNFGKDPDSLIKLKGGEKNGTRNCCNC